jgi:3-methylcrotonyl-CoA carboxylase alpha subunit
VQRRHQKVLEEAPAPGMTEAMRQQMGDAAVAAARAVNYVGAGTVEFIVEQRGGAKRNPRESGDPEMSFFFMEMNTRLQVEHPVTEAITGLDLVEWQLRVASGEPLPLKQEQLKIRGHAIEARICAENPDNNFLPATGRLDVARWPRHVSFTRGAVRLDTGFGEGDAVSPFYDSMIAKLIVHGDTREQALARLDEALARTHIVGVATNVQFLRYAVRSRSFAQADLDTALIQREAAVLFNQKPVSLHEAAAAAIAQALIEERATEGRDPFSRRDGWRSHGVATRRFEFDFGGEHSVAMLTYLHDGALALTVGNVSGALSFSREGDELDVHFAGERFTCAVYARGESDHVFTDKGAASIVSLDLLAHAGEGAVEGGRLTAPMPGKVVSFAVKPGDKVRKGQPLAVMEAMKMEHTIAAPVDGTVQELLYAPGDQVAEGAELLKLAT